MTKFPEQNPFLLKIPTVGPVFQIKLTYQPVNLIEKLFSYHQENVPGSSGALACMYVCTTEPFFQGESPDVKQVKVGLLNWVNVEGRPDGLPLAHISSPHMWNT